MPTMRTGLRAVVRGSRLIVHVLLGVIASLAVLLDVTGTLRPEPIAQRWSRRLLRILGIRYRVLGECAQGGTVIAANHVSWLDIPLLAACGHTRFIAKSEIRDWPVAGWLAQAAGTFYIRRGKGGARPVIERLVPHLAGGGGVVLFPEGTTSDGRQVLPFHARLFGAAIEAGAAVQPVALCYGLDHLNRDVAPFIGDDDLFRHILRLLRSSGLEAELHYTAPLAAVQLDRSDLAIRAENAVRAALGHAIPLPATSLAERALAA